LAGLLACFAPPQAAVRAEEEGAEPIRTVTNTDQATTDAGLIVYAWGQRTALPVSTACGDKVPDEDLRKPIEFAWFRRFSEKHGCLWQQLTFGPSFGAARSDAGKLYVWGSYKKIDGTRIFVEPTPLIFQTGGEDTRFVDVQCSESGVWGLSSAGQVVVWERVHARITEVAPSTQSSQAPKPMVGGRSLTGLDRPVIRMSIGVSHAAFITDDGEVFCLGSNRCGECGADPAVQGAASACRRVQFPRHCNPIARVSCGRSHTVAMGAEGQVLAWGDDSKIQLGLGDTRSNLGDERPWSGSRGYHRYLQTGEGMAPNSAIRGGPDSPSFGRAPSTSSKKYGEFQAHCQWRPTLMMDIPLEFERQVHGIPYPPPDEIECGDDFTLLLARDSPDWFAPEELTQRLFCCGENGSGQCGRTLQSSQQTLSAVRLPKNSRLLGVSCGSSHCVCLLRRVGSRKRELWVWGSNRHCQAAGTSSGVVCPSARLRLPPDARPEAVCCGFAASGVICSKKLIREESGPKLSHG